jgi:hypothetical protein
MMKVVVCSNLEVCTKTGYDTFDKGIFSHNGKFINMDGYDPQTFPIVNLKVESRVVFGLSEARVKKGLMEFLIPLKSSPLLVPVDPFHL